MGICNDQICNCALLSQTLTITGSGTPGDPWVLEQAEFSDITEMQNDIADIEAVLATLGATYVNVTGDTMTGPLIINATGASLSLRNPSDVPYLEWRLQDGTRVGYLQFSNASSAALMNIEAAMYYAIRTSAVERMRITATGFILIDKTATDISNNGIELQTLGRIWTTVSTAGNFNMSFNRTGAGDANGQKYADFQSGSSSIGSITRATASTVAYNTSSDENKKQNIRPVPDAQALQIMRSIEPVLFEFKLEPGSPQIGYIAQRVAAAWPQSINIGLVTPPEDPDIPPDSPDYVGWMMDPGKIVFVLHSAMQAMDRRFETFRTQTIAQITQLEARIAALEAP